MSLSLIDTHTHAHAHTSSVNIYKETSLCYVLRIPRYAWLILHKYLLTADWWTCSLVPKDVKFLGWRNRRYSLSWKKSSLLFRMSLVGPLNLCFFPARNIHSDRCWVTSLSLTPRQGVQQIAVVPRHSCVSGHSTTTGCSNDGLQSSRIAKLYLRPSV